MAAVYLSAMNPVSYHYHRFTPQIIQHAIWLYCRFTLSFRDVEDILAERGLDVSYETVRRWVLKFGLVLSRFSSGYLIANLAIKETDGSSLV